MGDWLSLGLAADFGDAHARCYLVRGRRLAVFRQDGAWFACDDQCPHAGAPLSDGWLDGGAVVCPWHGARFSLQNGACVGPFECPDARIYPMREENGILQVDWMIFTA